MKSSTVVVKVKDCEGILIRSEEFVLPSNLCFLTSRQMVQYHVALTHAQLAILSTAGMLADPLTLLSCLCLVVYEDVFVQLLFSLCMKEGSKLVKMDSIC
jgi:hypothetical protein